MRLRSSLGVRDRGHRGDRGRSRSGQQRVHRVSTTRRGATARRPNDREIPARPRDAALQEAVGAHPLGPFQTYTVQGMGELWEQMAASATRPASRWRCTCPKGGISCSVSTATNRCRPCHRAAARGGRPAAVCGACAGSGWAILPLVPQPDRPSLTPRELEAPRWTMEGKTPGKWGHLGISERTAVLHLNNAMHKLGVSKHPPC